MERVIRFMSIEEAIAILKGDTVKNLTEHIANTQSVGFCFTPTDESFYELATYLSGVATLEVGLVGKVKKGRFLESWGVYAYHSEGKTFGDKIKKRELCTKSYNLYDDFEEFDFYIPDFNSPILYSGSWKNPSKIEPKEYQDVQKI